MDQRRVSYFLNIKLKFFNDKRFLFLSSYSPFTPVKTIFWPYFKCKYFIKKNLIYVCCENPFFVHLLFKMPIKSRDLSTEYQF